MSLDLGGANVMIDLTRNRAKDKQAFFSKMGFTVVPFCQKIEVKLLKKRFFVSTLRKLFLAKKWSPWNHCYHFNFLLAKN
jgi:hypothetical protein